MLSYIIGILILCGIVIGVIAAIPYCLSLAHDAENEPNHLYNIFMEESGDRGIRVTGTVIVFLPISFFMFPVMSIEFAVISILFWCYFSHEHLQLYRGVSIFTPKMIGLLSAVILCHLTLAVLNAMEFINGESMVTIAGAASLGWGYMVNLKRSRVIQHNKQRQSDAKNARQL